MLASLEDSGAAVRRIALKALGRLDPATLAQHSDAVVARLDDSEAAVRKSALETLAALEPTALCHYAAALGMGAKDADEGVREVALAILRSLKGHVDLSETQSKLEPLELEEYSSAIIASLADSTRAHSPVTLTSSLGMQAHNDWVILISVPAPSTRSSSLISCFHVLFESPEHRRNLVHNFLWTLM